LADRRRPPKLCEIIRVAGDAGVKKLNIDGLELEFYNSPDWIGESVATAELETFAPSENVVHNDISENNHREQDFLEAELDNLMLTDPEAFERLQLTEDEG
jgi:hypothetical protein